jgi:hypothetical protein
VGAVKYLECMFNCYLKKYNAVTKNCVHFIFPLPGDTVPKVLYPVRVLTVTNIPQFVVKCELRLT